MHQSIPATPSPPPSPPGNCGAFACLVSPGGGASANFALLRGREFANPGAIPGAFDTLAVSYQSITTGFTGKKADWLTCQGQE